MESNDGCDEALRIVFLWRCLRGSLGEVQIWWNHPVGLGCGAMAAPWRWIPLGSDFLGCFLVVSKDVERLLYFWLLHVHDLKKTMTWYCGGGGWPCIAAASLASAGLLEGERRSAVRLIIVVYVTGSICVIVAVDELDGACGC